MNNIKKYLVIGNPISHSLSPDLHNYWLKKNNIDAIYNKKKMNLSDLENFFINLKDKKVFITGATGGIGKNLTKKLCLFIKLCNL